MTTNLSAASPFTPPTFFSMAHRCRRILLLRNRQRIANVPQKSRAKRPLNLQGGSPMSVSKKKIVLPILLLLVIAAAVTTLRLVSARAPQNRIVLSGTIEADEIHIGSKVGGRIAEVLVKEGQEVKEGQPLIRFERFDLDARR